MSLKKLREVFAVSGGQLPPGAEEAIALAEQSQRDEASYIEHLETKLKAALGEQPDGQEAQPSALRKEWEQSKGKSQGSHVDSLEFNQSTGTHVDASTGTHYCTRCLSNNKRSPLKDEVRGWHCMVCDQDFLDPARPPPVIRRTRRW